MINAVSFAPTNNKVAATNASTDPSNLSNADFTKLLLAQMANPDLSSLFNSGSNNNNSSGSSSSGSYLNSIMGSSNPYAQLLGNSGGSNSLSGLFSNSSSSVFAPSVNLAFYSNLIGKKVSFTDPEGHIVSGKVKSVLLENNLPMLNTEAGSIDPTSVTEVM